ncbi:MAG: PrsW family intramembrane metalloprotease [bacterium]|nr:PrsW family intramembrane metalloprotease [bacterium]
MTEFTPVLAAIAGGIFPALAWLWFWRREDSVHPEPRRLIALAFLAGMVAVYVAAKTELYVSRILVNSISVTILTFTVWPAIEEIVKFLAAYFTVLRRREDDEPIDPVIYMVAVALGFAAAENTLFLLSPLSGDTVIQTVLTGNLRTVGATLLHVLSSSIIGAAFGLSFYKSKMQKFAYAVIGVILAIALHGSFNYLILNTPEESLLRTFGYVWIALIALLAVLEYIKRIHPRIFK